MVTKNMIIEELTNRGYEVDCREVLKNGISREAFSIKGESNAAPTFYFEDILQRAYERDFSVDDIVDEVLEIFEKSVTSFNTEILKDKEYVLSHVFMAIQRESSEELVKRVGDFEGIETYLYLKVEINGGEGSIKLNKQILKMADISIDEAWESATKNLHNDVVVEPLADVIANIMGMNTGIEEQNNIYVLSNKSRIKGASAVLDKETIKAISEKDNVTRFIFLPSSIHEGILIPADNITDLEPFTRMVKEVNSTVVDDFEVLVDRAFFLTA